MKNLLLICCCLTLCIATSCFTDDETPGPVDSFMEVTIDGETVRFDQMLLTEVTTADETLTYRRITASIRDDGSKKINIHLNENGTGETTIFYIGYVLNGTLFSSEDDGATFNATVLENETATIIGTFNATLLNEGLEETENAILANGAFEMYN
ncbi:hypothetical protein [Cochleicola gelatinilyticus]|uniref:Lipocalin-like domain-containing protein n=1 Tax=Cochleicola gelatinilyticus TaxID=1763537 RepID=A0A167KAE4_9FLAO|nr:hypothetical protein [Cochleicola gelatinilyticus]OAB81561.1 hypothetical protein ULVI_01705 [Cochleicola gelatinilyticus]